MNRTRKSILKQEEANVIDLTPLTRKELLRQEEIDLLLARNQMRLSHPLNQQEIISLEH
jgi:hypothetical protein